MHKLISERATTHGEFNKTARRAVCLQNYCKNELTGDGLAYVQQHALDMILTKVARIISGDADHADHWRDIAGYALLACGDEK